MSERNEKKWLELVSRMGSAEEAQLYIDFQNSCVEMGAFLDLEDAWKARAEIAAKRERELVEALQTYRDAVIYFNERCRPDVPGTMLLGFQKLFEAVEQGDKALAKHKAENSDG